MKKIIVMMACVLASIFVLTGCKDDQVVKNDSNDGIRVNEIQIEEIQVEEILVEDVIYENIIYWDDI